MTDPHASVQAKVATAAAPFDVLGTDHLLRQGDVMTASEVADLLSVPKSTVEEWARRGVLPSRKRGKRRFFLRWEIREWLVADDEPRG